MSAESEPNHAPEGIWLARPEAFPTDGISLAVKDLFDTAGLTTTYGSILFADHVPERSAEAVVRLERAGYVNVGKTNLHEFAYGVTSQNPHFGTVPNPIAPGRTAGGSSGGSAAALAAGLADAALGTDSGGSIRIPAACCGIVGFKPSYGLVPLDGCFPLAPTFDHAGPMARTVADCRAMLEALAPEFLREPAHHVSVGVAWADQLHSARRRPDPPGGRAARCPSRRLPAPDGDWQGVHARGRRRPSRSLRGERRQLRRPTSEPRSSSAWRSPTRRRRTPPTGATPIARRRRPRWTISTFCSPRPSLSSPRLFRDDEREIREALIQFTFPFNALGWPALALPAGPAEDGLPASIQLVGRPGADALVLAVGEKLEASLVRGTA